MIFATERGEARLGVNNPDKKAILAFMSSFEPTGYAEGFVVDLGTGEPVKSLLDNGYEVDGLYWSAGDMYNFEKNDIALTDEFCRSVCEKL